MSIKTILDEIGNESSTNKKMEILKKHKETYRDQNTLQLVLYMACSKRAKFYIKQIPAYTSNTVADQTLVDAINLLNDFRNRSITGNDSRDALKEMLESLTPDDAYVLERIIEKDLKIGMGGNINKIFPKLIEETPYMGAKPYSADLVHKLLAKGPAFSQIKMDGRYNNAIIRGNDVELESRAGEPVILTGAKFISEIEKLEDCVLNGELTIDGKTRYESNGIIASLISIQKKQVAGEDVTKEIEKFAKEEGMTIETALNSIKYTLWDMITIEEYFAMFSDRPYDERLETLEIALKGINPTIVEIAETEVVRTFAEATAHFKRELARGNEGTILKYSKAKWKDGKHGDQIKFKLEMNVDLKIVGFNYGTGKNAKVISSLKVSSSDGLVNTQPAGMKEKEMKFITANMDKLLGKIVDVKCSGLSKDEDGNYALLHPVFIEIRDDKTEADDLLTIQKNEEAIKTI